MVKLLRPSPKPGVSYLRAGSGKRADTPGLSCHVLSGVDCSGDVSTGLLTTSGLLLTPGICTGLGPRGLLGVTTVPCVGVAVDPLGQGGNGVLPQAVNSTAADTAESAAHGRGADGG